MDKLPIYIYSDLIGKDFRYGGRGPSDFDCLGLCYEIMKRQGTIIKEQESIIDRHLRGCALEIGKNLFTRIEEPIPGSLVAFNVAGIVGHVGIIIDKTRFIHIERSKRVSIEKLRDLKWKRRVEGFYIFGERNEK